MIAGRFGENGELLFEIQLVAANGEQFSLEALFDTGFTSGWLSINSQDLKALDWSIIIPICDRRVSCLLLSPLPVVDNTVVR